MLVFSSTILFTTVVWLTASFSFSLLSRAVVLSADDLKNVSIIKTISKGLLIRIFKEY